MADAVKRVKAKYYYQNHKEEIKPKRRIYYNSHKKEILAAKKKKSNSIRLVKSVIQENKIYKEIIGWLKVKWSDMFDSS